MSIYGVQFYLCLINSTKKIHHYNWHEIHNYQKLFQNFKIELYKL